MLGAPATLTGSWLESAAEVAIVCSCMCRHGAVSSSVAVITHALLPRCATSLTQIIRPGCHSTQLCNHSLRCWLQCNGSMSCQACVVPLQLFSRLVLE